MTKRVISGSSGIRVIEADEALALLEIWQIDPDIVARFFTLEEG